MRKIQIALTVVITLAALLSGCSSQPTQQSTISAPAVENSATDASRVKQALYAQYDEWKAVKYKDGGLSKHGVDCSGFVYLTYDERFAIKLPRSTEELVNVGPEIPQRDLEPGDLVFFKTGWKMRHVGIYIEDGKFLHVSSSHGVIISNLDNEYWTHAYWKAVRVRPAGAEFTYAH